MTNNNKLEQTKDTGILHESFGLQTNIKLSNASSVTFLSSLRTFARP